ncbi:ACP S-malonyltransferase [Amycolatopsis balhimycina DSM 5908]|uniref:[acyl-carrier-protein] S-malonyltransferase n=1 Tax=Amycolatopsis balhimycina DSM 5908 TaxID=1081091 RepID=A0A428WSH5_AMYBA|nr:ACP S-malonyltransferase [Amycolatopsis balhimycina]RSM46036.1 ACP S-malonyltransferase [Amycolatopsis balhimycina DSM 5908]
MKVVPSRSRSTVLPFCGRTDPPTRKRAPGSRQHPVAGVFPGLGSRAAYQDLGRHLLDSGSPAVREVYRQAAQAFGVPGRPEKLLLIPENLPAERLAQQAFLGAAILVHSLALEAHLRDTAAKSGVPLHFVAYTGESFGIITSAVASGALSVGDGVEIARVFTPLMLVAAEGAVPDEPVAREVAAYLPESLRGRQLVPEPFHVVALKGDPGELAGTLGEIGKEFPKVDVEIHKFYSDRQTNVYVRRGVKADFDELMARFPAVRAEELKKPTNFLAHSGRMGGVREALGRFLDAKGIVFHAPHTPVVSNHGAGLLTTAEDVRTGILAITDEVMASRETAATLADLHPELVVELGLGEKSVQLLNDNDIAAPVTAYTGDPTDPVLRVVKQVDVLLAQLEKLRESGDRLDDRHLDTLRDLFRLTSGNRFGEEYLFQNMRRVITEEMFRARRDAAPAFYELLEVFQHTHRHRADIDAGDGELVLRARLKKELTGDRPGEVYTELRLVDRAGRVTDRKLATTGRHEVVVVHFDRLAYHSQAAIPRQQALFQALRHDRPALFRQNDCYLEGSDPVGWLAALAASGAAPPADVVALHDLYREFGTGLDLEAALDRVVSSLTSPELPLVSPAGVPLWSAKDVAAATRGVFLDGALDTGPRRIHLNGNCRILALGSAFEGVDAGPHRADVISISSPAEVRTTGVNAALDEFEDHCLLSMTVENEKVLRYAQSRRVLSGTVNAYLEIGERVLGFGNGGSESMTIFLRKDGEDRTTVRKVLSEALTTVSWNPDGRGVMLPPFAKARKQAEYLQALPESVRRYFPEVYDIQERVIPVPPHLRTDGTTTRKEVIYEMSYVPGEEVSRFVERNSPPPAVVARLYEQIFRVLNREVHTVNRVPAPGETLDVSYFRKIEDRLALCRRTAPRTFTPELLDTERIVIDGVSYLNAPALLARFRAHPEYLRILEPRFHSLVMGDTNTENIKVENSVPLLHAQWLIEQGAPREEIDAALAAITAESVGIRFLDPRAIGFKSDGRDTRDDAMYDNKPWHNSIGHYDEIHYEQFTLRVRTGAGRTPRVDIGFVAGNPYQKSYGVRDVVARGEDVDPAAPRGMEDYFATVMAAVHRDDPESRQLKDPYWLIRFVFMMGTHFTAMPPFHFQSELDGTLTDTYQAQRRPVAIYCEGVKWLNWALQLLTGERTEFLGVPVPSLAHLERPHRRTTSAGHTRRRVVPGQHTPRSPRPSTRPAVNARHTTGHPHARQKEEG